MSSLASTQVQKPADEQAFERACVILWRHLLGDPNVQRNGRRGQRQNGVDLYGYRGRDSSHLVGIQCKLKGPEQELTEQEVSAEFQKALAFRPPLSEYFIVTTAPDDGALHEKARLLSAEQKSRGREISFSIWGWNTLEERIQEHPEAHRAFDPSYNAYAAQILVQGDRVLESQEALAAETRGHFGGVFSSLNKLESWLPTTEKEIEALGIDRHLNAEIDGYRDLLGKGKALTALGFLEHLWERVGSNASGVIRFRIKANIALCKHALGENDAAAALMLEACQYAPTDRRAVANRIFVFNVEQQWDEAVAFGRRALAEDPTNEWVANHLIQAARHVPAIKSALDLIPQQLRTAKAVLIANAIFLRYRQEIPAWWTAARAAVAAAPDDSLCKQFAAEADLDEIGRDFRSHLDRGLTETQRVRLLNVVRVLSAEWKMSLESEASSSAADLALASNLISCHRMLGAHLDALQVARAGLATGISDGNFQICSMLAALEGGDDNLALSLLPQLPDLPEAAMLRFQFYMQRGQWAEISALDQEFASLVPLEEREIVATGIELAVIRQQPSSVAQRMLEALIDKVASNARSSVLAAQMAKELNYAHAFEVAFANAISAIGFRSHGAARHMVGMYAVRIRRWKEAADILDGRIALDVDSEELRALAISLVNDLPVKNRALRFTDSLGREIARKPYFLYAVAMIHYNSGDLDRASEKLQELVAAEPNNLNAVLALVSTLHRQARTQSIGPLLRELDLSRLEGRASDKMKLAHAVAEFSDDSVALAFAYQTLLSAPNDPKVVAGYFGLIVGSKAGQAIPHTDVVEVDRWVKVENEAKESFSFTVESAADNLFAGTLSPTHPIVNSALGLKVGDTFIHVLPIGVQQTWRIVEIEHKYVQALRSLVDNFEVRFPNSRDLLRVPTDGNDIQPILDQVRKYSESRQELARLYIDQRIPLAIVAQKFRGGVLGLVEQVHRMGGNVSTCLGGDAERKLALDVTDSLPRPGVVLDTYSAWVSAELDVLDVIESVLGKLIVPRSVIDDLASVHDAVGDGNQDGQLSIGWENGGFVRHQYAKEEIAAQIRYIENIQSRLRCCEVVAVSAPDLQTRIGDHITSNFGPHALDSAYLSGQSHVLLSEDLYYRELAREAVGARSVWLQIVLWSALNKGKISQRRYTRATAQLALRRHGHINVDVATLIDSIKEDEGLRLFSALANYIGVKDANVVGHTLLVSEFVRSLWSDEEIPSLSKHAATSIMLERIVLYQWSRYKLLLATIRIASSKELRVCIDKWIVGHFLPMEDIDAVENIGMERRLMNMHADRLRGASSGVCTAALSAGYLSSEELSACIFD